jgi:hypothetical protein
MPDAEVQVAVVYILADALGRFPRPSAKRWSIGVESDFGDAALVLGVIALLGALPSASCH